MKAVGLAVVTYKGNYGSLLQSYATQAAVAKAGFRPEIIPIEPFSRTIRRGKSKFFLSRLGNAEERKYVWGEIGTKIRTVVPGAFARNVRRREQKYREFARKHFQFSNCSDSVESVTSRCREYRSVVVGSDQLWRPSNIEGDFFTLSFVPDEVRKIAYATSFGVAKLPSRQRTKAALFLSRIEHLSVREEAGRAIVKALTGRDVPVVCDPSMLLDAHEWSEVQTPGRLFAADYILCYFLGDNKTYRAFARRLARFTGLKVIGLLHAANFIRGDDAFPDVAMYDVGPAEFINLIQNASLVCTDSFHGTVFSILFKRPFFAFRRFADEDELSTNDRLATLLGWSGLDARLLSGSENPKEMAGMEIDYDAVLNRVAWKREEGMAYLGDALRAGQT